MQPTSDEDLFAAFRQSRDVDALATLFRRRADELLRLAVFLAPRPTDAEDLVQATFLSAIARAETYRPGHRVMSWLCGILTNHARMLRRTERRRGPEPAAAAHGATPVDAALQSELKHALRDSIAALKEPYRSVLQLHLEGGLNSQQIGAQLNQKPATVRKQMARAIEQLRTALPLGLATALVVRMSPGQLAERAAEAAQFVGPDGEAGSFAEASDAAPAGQAAATGATWRALLAGLAAVAALIVAIVWRPDDGLQPPRPTTERAAPGTTVHAPQMLAQPGPEAPPVGDTAQREGGPSHTLLVHAVAPDGRPHAGLELWCVADDGRPFPVRALAGEPRRATTDEHGDARFADLPRGRYELTIAGALPKCSVRVERDDQQQLLHLPHLHRHQGHVTAPDGRPVAGALVLITETAGRGDLPTVLAETDATGQFDAHFPMPQGRVFARHPSFAQSPCRRLAPGRELHLELEPPVPSATVQVQGGDGAPIPDALVAVVPKSQDTDFYVPQLARTDARGRCTLPGPGPRHAAVLVQCRGFAATTEELLQGDEEVQVVMQPPTRIVGTARTADGQPIVDREVTISVAGLRTNEPTGPMLALRTRTDEQGRFAVDGAPRAALQVRMHGSGNGRRGPPMSQFVLAGVDVDTRERANQEIELRAPAASIVRGTLRTPDGEPLADWHLMAVPELGTAAHRMLRRRVARSDEHGRFELHAVAPDERYQIGCYPPERWWPNELSWPLAFATARVGEACDVIADPDAPTSATLTCQALLPNGRPARRATFELRHVAFQAPLTCTADASGRCQFGPLASGDYWLVVVCPGLGSRTLPVHIDDDRGTLDLGPVQLQRPARVAVRLLAPTTTDVAGLRVVAKNRIGDKFVAARSNHLGVAGLRPLPPGPSNLLVYGLGIAPTRLERVLEPGVQWLDVDVHDAAPVTLRFPFALAENPFVINGPLHVRIFDADGHLVLEDYLGATTVRGRFDMKLGLPAGTYRVRARSIWNALADETLVVTAGAALLRELPLRL